MITISDIAAYINQICPEALSFDGDNVGHLVGRGAKKVQKVLVTLDVDEHVVQEAADKGADLIVAHHPMMFHPIGRITDSNPQQRALMLLVQNDIAMIAAHTNLDCVYGGLNDYLASKLGIQNTSVIEPVSDWGGVCHGFGRVGEVSEGTTVSDMLSRCISALGIEAVRYVGDKERIVKKVAVNCGGGAGEMNLCIDMGVDLFITGDVKYNPARDAYESGMAVIDAGHYETEHIAIELISSIIAQKYPELTIMQSEANTAVFKYYVK